MSRGYPEGIPRVSRGCPEGIRNVSDFRSFDCNTIYETLEKVKKEKEKKREVITNKKDKMLNYALNAKRSSTIKHKVNKIYTIKVMQKPKEINDYSPLFIDGHLLNLQETKIA